MKRKPGMRVHRFETLVHRFETWAESTPLVDWITSPGVQRLHVLLPSLPRFISRRLGTAAPLELRSLAIPELPEELKTYPGTLRDRAAEEESFRTQGPLPVLLKLHREAAEFFRHQGWFVHHVLYGPQKMARLNSQLMKAPVKRDGVVPAQIDPAELTRRVKAKAAEIGLSSVGVTRFDPVLTQAPYLGDEAIGDRVIVTVVEQNWAATQKIPGTTGDRGHADGITESQRLTVALAAFLTDLGYSASPSRSNGMAVAYGVEAGLGQLGLNGQLLTPFAGSRCRLGMITTDAPLVFDAPVDYGIPAVCDRCKACVRNCPSGAITSKRQMHRGVFKAKIKLDRCFPILAQTHGCGICMKVCPVQHYGLPAVIEEFKRSGQILGKGTDELEGYVWPLDGRYYGPNQRPRSASTPEVLNPPGFVLNLERSQIDPEDFDEDSLVGM